MKVIYKYEIVIKDNTHTSMPKGAKIIKFGKQGMNYFIWAIVDPTNNVEMRNFSIVGTGNPIREDFLDNYYYIDSWIESGGGQFVWHLFESHRR